MGGNLKHLILKFILFFSTALSLNSVLAVPLSSVINSDIQQVEYRQIPADASLRKVAVAQSFFQLTKSYRYKKQQHLFNFLIQSPYFSKNSLVGLTASRAKQDYQQQSMTMLTFTSQPEKLLFKLVSYQSEDQALVHKKSLS